MHPVVANCCNKTPELNNGAIIFNQFVYCAKMFKKKSVKGKV